MYLQVLVGANAPVLMTQAAAAASSGVNVAAAVFGTLGALALASVCIVVCLPNAGFHVGATRVVPADIIKGAASGVYSGAAHVGSAAYSLVASGGSSRSKPTSMSTSSYTYASAPVAERSALIK